MPQLDISTFTPQIIWLIITFGVLYLLMAKLALPRIGSILEQRQNRIEDNLAMAQNLKRESDDIIYNLTAKRLFCELIHCRIQHFVFQ